MKMNPYLSLLMALIGVVAFPADRIVLRQEGVPISTLDDKIPQPDNMRQEVFTYLNQARSKPCKCAKKRYPATTPLIYNEKLANAAQKHALWMASFLTLSHTQPKRDAANSWDRITREDYRWSLVEGNIAAGQPTAREVVEGWINSPDHCQNLMNGIIKEVGIGLQYTTRGKYHYYWVADFATPMTTQ